MSKHPTMDLPAQNLAETFQLFKQGMNLICDDDGVMDSRKIAVRSEGFKRINTSTLGDDRKKDPPKLYTLYKYQLDVHLNFRILQMELMRYKQREN